MLYNSIVRQSGHTSHCLPLQTESKMTTSPKDRATRPLEVLYNNSQDRGTDKALGSSYQPQPASLDRIENDLIS